MLASIVELIWTFLILANHDNEWLSLVVAPLSAVREMQKEMLKAGLVSEMMDDALESLDDAELESEADAEVEGVLFELTLGVLGQAAPVQNRRVAAVAAAPAEEKVDDEDAEMEAMRARLQKIQS